MRYNKTYDKARTEIIKKSRSVKNKEEAHHIKRLVSKKYGLDGVVSDSELYNLSGLNIFSRKPSRRLSGVSVVAVMTSPAKCPHGKCVFCPGGVEFMTPQSYTGDEPAAMRARANDYNAYKQVRNRLKQYYIIGQVPSKVELIIMGGTFTSRSWSYQKSFVIDCFKALNNQRVNDLKKLQEYNTRKAVHKCVGLTVETRPDQITKNVIKRMLELGATRVELGVQSVFDKVLKKSGRGHSVKDIIRATKLLKDSGFKINYHLMTNMPGSSKKLDYESFKTIFTDSRFKPDMVKIYPTLLIKGTKLYELFKKKEWVPYSEADTIKLVSRIKRIIPSYTRVMRLQRDIPSYRIEQDLKSSNLRQLVQGYMKSKGWNCKCIRCREIGRNTGDLKSAVIKVRKYEASNGSEFFIESSDKSNIIFGFLRARVKNKIMLVRELHVYGEQVPVGGEGIIQHKGIGKILMHNAEELGKKIGVKKIKVISGVGVRGYYEKLGYVLIDNYMLKFI